MSDKKTSFNPIKYYIKIAPRVYKTSPGIIVITIIIAVFQAILLAVNTPLMQKLFESAAKLSTNQTKFMDVIIWIAIIAIVTAFQQIINGTSNFLAYFFYTKAVVKLHYETNLKMSKLDPMDFENTDKLDDMNKVSTGIGAAIYFCCNIIFLVFFYLVYFIVIDAYLFSLRPLLALVVVFAFVPIMITHFVRTKIFSELEDTLAPIRRENEYFETTCVERTYFKETRLLGGFTYFCDFFKKTLKSVNKLKFKVNVKNNLVELILRGITAASFACVIYILFNSVINGIISVGAFAAVFGTIGMIFYMFEEIMFQHIKHLAENVGTIHNYLDFLNIPERGGEDMDISLTADIELRNVSFTYPNSETPALKNINFTLKHGETVAIVGENGSGKSTLTRLIMGLYTPTEGEVLIDGTPTSEISMKSLFKNTTATFQKYQRYQMTLKDNLEISDMSKQSDVKNLDEIAEQAGVDVNSDNFPEGYDTMLSREFDGVDLSGGQWQRVAIARGFYREHNLIILDEPTAAIDPFEEAKIYNKFAESAKEKTAIIVTHRLGSVKLADRIAVMAQGEIVEDGGHDELLQNNGEYARLWKAQEQWYK